ncbi:MAG: nucleoside/nucleotide kinase family protein [Actinomycetota bacterium]|nr:nucleoside/nucleotide kinase family protein [Actinomycetota bacterium]
MSADRTLDTLVAEAQALGRRHRRAVLGIAGNPGAGKSTLAALLLAELAHRCGHDWAAHLPMDGFHLADEQLRRLGLLDRKGAPETFDATGYAQLLERVRVETDQDVYAPGFDRDLEQPLAGALAVPPAARLVLTEGNYLLLDDPRWARARNAMDAVWFVTGDQRTRTDRLIARHIRFGKTPQAAQAWVAEVDARNAALVAATQPGADRVVVNGAHGWEFRA